MTVDFGTLMEPVARRLLGEPNSRLSKPPKELRFGTHGSMAINLESGIFFDHEAKVGGGTIDLIVHIQRCNHLEAMSWMRSEGLLNGQAAPEQPQIVAEYDYPDEEGEPLFQVVRYEPKTFRQRRRDRSGNWIWNISGVRRVLYRLPQLIEAIACEHPVFICEGEKDADNLIKLGVVATTNSGGAGKWLQDYNKTLRDADVIIMPDNDAVGRAHAETVARSLSGIARRIRIFDVAKIWSECPPKGDISDWINAGGTVEELNRLVEELTDWSPSPNDTNAPLNGERAAVLLRADTLKPEAINWAWPNRFAFGKMAMIAGDPGLGKSTILAEIAAIHSRGGDFPCGEGTALQCEVLFLTAEDGLRDTLVPRLKAADADLQKINFLVGTKGNDSGDDSITMFDITRDVQILRDVFAQNPEIKILIIDPITAYLGSGTKAKENTDVRRVLTPLVKLVEEFRVLLLANNHLNKNGGKSLYRVLDSIAFVALGRTVHLVVADADNPENRKLICDKSSIGSKPLGVTYIIQKCWIKGEEQEEIETSRICWGTKHIDETADEALGNGDDTPTMAEEAGNFLREVLAQGRMAIPDVEAEARAAGLLSPGKAIIDSKPFRTARKRLSVTSERKGFGPGGTYYWRLP